jgi:hypothetical protein
MPARSMAARLDRLERARRPPVRWVTLEDLVWASYGRPLPEGATWGGPLAAFAAQLGGRA